MSEKKVSGKVLMFTGIVIIVFLVAIFGFIFWEPVPEMIQGEAEATEVRISGKVPGRIERFLVDEGDQVMKGDIFLVRPVENVPVDGVILEGTSALNEAALTGESNPVDKKPGDVVSAASLNQSGFIRC